MVVRTQVTLLRVNMVGRQSKEKQNKGKAKQRRAKEKEKVYALAADSRTKNCNSHFLVSYCLKTAQTQRQ